MKQSSLVEVVDIDEGGMAVLLQGDPPPPFREYKEVCDRFGARYVPAGPCMLCDVRSLGKLTSALAKFDIVLQIRPELRDDVRAAIADPPAGAAIYFRAEGEDVTVFVAGGRLERAQFQVYSDLSRQHGVRYDRASNLGICPLSNHRLPAFVKALRKKGFALDLPAVVRQGMTDQLHADQAAAKHRDAHLVALEADLEQRDLALFPFQRCGISWLAARRRALLADDMGLGKTMQVLLATPHKAPLLVVCPAIAKGVWQREAALWRPELKVCVLSGRGSFRWPHPGELVVINYAILPDSLPPRCPDQIVLIGDEAHAVKNRLAKRTLRFAKLATVCQHAIGRVWLLTATPLLNRPPELWTILSAAELAEDAFDSWNTFKQLFNSSVTQVARGRWVTEWGEASSDVPERLERVMLRRIKADVLPELPTKRYQELTLPGLDTRTQKLCEQAEKALTELGIHLHEENDDLLERISKAALGRLETARTGLARWKTRHLLALVEQYEEQEEPLVVFSAHRHPIDALGQRSMWATITGDTPPAERTAIEQAFQAGTLRGIAATIRAGGVSITLTRASHCVFVDLDWTPALNQQAEDRLLRIGQDRGVLITHLVADNLVDQRVTRALAKKTSLIDQVIVG